MKFTTKKATGSTPDAPSRARSAALPREAPPYHGKRADWEVDEPSNRPDT
ncbi:MAG: hypothetical protein ACOX5T_08520 [Candidatus Cryptobacteroides sp.]